MMNQQRRKQMSDHHAASVIQAGVRGKQARGAIELKKDMAAQLLAEAAAAEQGSEVAPDKSAVASGLDDVDGGSLPLSMYAELDRDRLCSDLLNTSVCAALVGGFALGNMVDSGDTNLDNVIYTMSCMAVHACTCSCLTSALLYREVVRFREEVVPAWAKSHRLLIMMAPMKFGMGCLSYLGSVVLISFRDLSESKAFQITCLVIGLMSMSTVLATVAIVYGPSLCKPKLPAKPSNTRVAPG